MQQIDPKTTYSVRVFPPPQHGSITLSQERVQQGTNVFVYVNPDPGYVLLDGSLISQSEIDGNPSGIPKDGEKYQLSITQYNVAVTASFVPKVPGTYTVSVDPSLTHGKMYAYPLAAPSGTPVRLVLLPDAGYDLVPGSLTLEDGTPVSEVLPFGFTLPSRDVTVIVQFEEKGYEALLASADKYLNVGEYDTAASFYKEAYKKNQTDPKTILYSTFAELGGLLIDPDVRSTLSMTAGYEASFNAPGTIDGWMCDTEYVAAGGGTWYSNWPGVTYDTAAENKNPPLYVHTTHTTEDVVFPQISLRGSNFVTPFGDFHISQQKATRQKFFNILFWSLIASNPNGFNGLLEKVNRYVFGAQFEAIAARAASFPANARVPLNNRLKERFGLEDIYGSGPTEIGKAELDYIFANLRAVKAIFEYLTVYDWAIDLRPWLTSEIHVDDGLDQILHKIFSQAASNDKHKEYWKTPSTVANILPFKNSFLHVRDTKSMDRARVDFSKALQMANDSMAHWYGASSNFTAAAQAEHQWAKDGLAAAKTAFDGNGVFYFPKKLPKSEAGAVWPNEAAADYGLSVVEFFRPGALSLTNFFTTELGGRAPSLFKVKWYEDSSNSYAAVITDQYELVTASEPSGRDAIETNVNGTGNSAPYRIYSFEMNTAYIKQLFPKGFTQFGEKAPLYKVFPTIPLWPIRPTYFIGTNISALNLYYYYHWR
ncbi:hypothetical protein AGMMS4952_12670 [Spirochaetia bacterium]|nr:hypothetical protein AGMMS4952_12670 [Spirochaetia bacterium]